jgi:hypothetical protein
VAVPRVRKRSWHQTQAQREFHAARSIDPATSLHD